MGEVFQFIFNSQGSNVLNNANIAAVTYNVKWNSFLPEKYKKFSCKFTLKSQPYIYSILNDHGFVSLNSGRNNVWDGLQQSNIIGTISPVVLSTSRLPEIVADLMVVPIVIRVEPVTISSMYESSNTDNTDFLIDYPSNTIVTVELKTFTGIDLPNMQHYALILTLTGIET